MRIIFRAFAEDEDIIRQSTTPWQGLPGVDVLVWPHTLLAAGEEAVGIKSDFREERNSRKDKSMSGYR